MAHDARQSALSRFPSRSVVCELVVVFCYVMSWYIVYQKSPWGARDFFRLVLKLLILCDKCDVRSNQWLHSVLFGNAKLALNPEKSHSGKPLHGREGLDSPRCSRSSSGPCNRVISQGAALFQRIPNDPHGYLTLGPIESAGDALARQSPLPAYARTGRIAATPQPSQC